MDALPEDFFIQLTRFTRTIHNDPYPSIDPQSPDLSLSGKVAMITGASGGIGAKALAPAFAKAGVKGLVLLATHEEHVAPVAERIKTLYPNVNVLALGFDISNSTSVDAAFEKIKDTFGHADILINSAGVNASGDGTLVGEEDPDSWWRNFEINGKGVFLLSRAFIRHLPSTDTPATIVNLTTSAAWITFPPLSGYGISKAIPIYLAQNIAKSYPNITVVSLHPGMVESSMIMTSHRRFKLQSAEMVGGIAVWLSHPHAKFLSGRTVASQWDVDELVARKDEIVGKGLLQVGLSGSFGAEQFV